MALLLASRSVVWACRHRPLRGYVHSADTFSSVIDRKIAKELALGRILGPFDVMPNYPNYRIPPLGVVPKKTG